SLSTCPPLSTDDKIARSDAVSRAHRRNSTVHSSTKGTPSRIPVFHAGSSRAARASHALYADKRDLDTENAALVRLAGDVSLRSPTLHRGHDDRRSLEVKARWTAVAESHSQRWRAGVAYGSAA